MDKTKTPEKTPSRLGRGLSALIPPTAPAVPAFSTTTPAARPTPGPTPEGVQEIALADIAANPHQPRTVFNETAIDELTASIKLHGVLQPVMVRPRGGGRYEIVAGERRFRAAERAELKRIPAVVRSLTDEEALTVALIENIQREDLNPIEAARGYKQLMEEYGLTQVKLGEQIGKKQSTISNAMRLLLLPVDMQDSICDGRIGVEHGKELLGIPDPRKRRDVWEDILTMKMNRDDAREHARLARFLSKPGAAAHKDSDWVKLEERLRVAIGSKVEFKPAKSGGGAIIIKFADNDELEGVLEKLKA